VSNEIRNLTRWLKEKKKLFEFEKLCLHYLAQLIEEPSAREQKRIWKNFADGLTALSNIKYERNAMFSFHFLEWAKLKGEL
jgi:hypothetical protein